MSLHGRPKYDGDFKYFDYVNPTAPKAGTLSLGIVGDFDSFNPFILAGLPGVGSGAAVEQLMVRNPEEEDLSAYGLIAETVEWPQDRSWVAFELRPEARWHDGEPITADDVVFSFRLLRSQGHPRYSRMFRDVRGVRSVSALKVRFDFAAAAAADLAFVVGEMPILPEHYWRSRDFTKPSLSPPLGSGPYRIVGFEAGGFVELQRVADYWGKSLPVNIGYNNFERIRYEYFPDLATLRDGLMAGRIDMTVETSMKAWTARYDGPSRHGGWLKLETVPHGQPVGFQGFVFNTRRPPFDDRKVRRAIALAFDFEWTRKALLFGATSRTTSYFENTDLAARGLPSTAEMDILEPYSGRVPDEVYHEVFDPPGTDGSGWSRENRRRALGLLEEAGWEVRGTRLVEPGSGRPLDIEIVLANRALLPLTQGFARNLERLGIDVRVRVLNKISYDHRVASFDFDMVSMALPQSAWPGGELRDYWSSLAATQRGSHNLAGIADPVVDELIEGLLAATDRQSLIERARALDRVLLWGHYTIPHFHSKVSRLVSWDKFGRPGPTRTGTGPGYWWFDRARADALQRARDDGWSGPGEQGRARPVQ